MKQLAAVNKYFVRYKWRLLLGILFVTISNLFAVLPPVVIRNVIDQVQANIDSYHLVTNSVLADGMRSYIFTLVLWNGLLLLGLALLRGVFMFFMRQTIIVMSRLIEYDQKNEIYDHYQQLDTHFYKTHFTGDLMNRMAEDVSRVRQYTGPAIMYSVNLFVLSVMCIWGMVRVDAWLTLYVVAPLPLLAFSIYFVNRVIYRKSEKIQAQLSDLTTTAQESYSGIRVIKSFVQEKNMLGFFRNTSEQYKESAINLSLTEAIYFPSMNLFIGLSMLITVLIGGYMAIKGNVTPGNIAEFVIYINLLMFPISSIGWVASITQRAAASQKRINEFLDTDPKIVSPAKATESIVKGDVEFSHIQFTYPHTGILALNDFNLHIKVGQKVAVIGKTGSGKSTLAHMLLRMYDPQEGDVKLDGVSVRDFNLQRLRAQIAYAPQEAFLFSDTIYNNIKFGREDATESEVKEAARLADLEKDIATFAKGYETVIGERGVMLSGGQKQRMVLARALLKNSNILLLDESLSAVDTKTEKTILGNLNHYLRNKTAIVITHRIFTSWVFDQIIMLDDGQIVEQGTHDELMQLNGRYAKLYRHQTETNLA
ncbi:ABC transporter ATP-binding protein [Taibaiella soli]|uniref:ABC transporter n=1 Tax=Taibaiella soli TaxID=1649169 RepID=A0A2W2AA02_9BACT|nr:ABC transporter ATP-binding protein [Taibaiella soli]PZF72225.1 ABC transporter [Taibaiella soli]